MYSNELNETNYLKIMELFQRNGYEFTKYNNSTTTSSKYPILILRHDVDFDMQIALRMATLEHINGIHSTYFIHLRSSLYNPISEINLDLMQKIHSLGHDIAVHVTYRDDLEKLSIDVVNQIQFLSFYFNELNTKIVSFHKPGKKAKNISSFLLPNNISHTYEKKFFKDIQYYSDSGGRWQYGNPVNSIDFSNKKSMQILTHPIWWLERGNSPLEKIRSFLRHNNSITLDLIQQTIISYPLITNNEQDSNIILGYRP